MIGIARCGNCLYFCPQEKTSVGCKCANYHMNKRRHTNTASLKQPSSVPCSQYIKDPDKTYIPKKLKRGVKRTDKELDLMKQAILIICRNVRPDGEIGYLDWEDRCRMKDIYDELVRGE